MKKRMARVICFLLTVSMVFLSVDMSVFATEGLDGGVEVLSSDISSELSTEEISDFEDDTVISDEEDNVDSTEVTLEEEQPEEVSEEISEEELPEEAIQEGEISQEESDLSESDLVYSEMTAVTDYDDVLPVQMHKLNLSDVEDEVIPAELLLESGEISLFTTVEDEHDWSQYSNYYIYNQLNESEKKLWDAMEVQCNMYMNQEIDCVYDSNFNTWHTGMIELETTEIDEQALAEFVMLFLYSHPQYYFLQNSILYVAEADYVMLTYCVYDKFADGTERKAITDSIMALLETWYAQIALCETDEQKALKIHDLICDRTDYNHDVVVGGITLEEEAVSFTQTAYSVFCMEQTVCAGYTQAYSWVCNGAGVDTIGVTSEDHAWNKVRINDSWYNVDCTWDDGEGYYGYYRFLRDDVIFNGESHEEQAYWVKYIPACTLDSGSTDAQAGSAIVITEQAEKPVINLVAGETTYTVEMTSGTENARIYYTLDGTVPSSVDTKSFIYSEPFQMNADTTIRAIAVCNEHLDSVVAEEEMEMLLYTVAEGKCGNNITWSLDSGGNMTLSGTGAMADYQIGTAPWDAYLGDIKTVVIGEGITNIGTYCFYGIANLQSVTIPSTVTKINDEAFRGSGIEYITIPTSVKEIGKNAFAYCEKLQSIVVPENVTKLGEGVFRGCSSLESASVLSELDTLPAYMFFGCLNLSEVRLPSNYTAVPQYFMAYCESMTEIVLPDTVTSIGTFAFYYSGIEKFTISDHVTNIGSYAFYRSNIELIYIPETVTAIGSGAFSTGVTIVGHVGSKAESFAKSAGLSFVDIVEYGICIQYETGCDTSIKTQYCMEGSRLKVPVELSKTGYTFGGWYTSADVQTEATAWDFAVDIVTEDITLYAKWTANTYRIGFDANYEGAEAIDSKMVVFDSACGELPELNRTGYTFKGWYTGKTDGVLLAEESIYKIAEDVVLYARWVPNSYYVIFDANGGEVAIDRTMVVYDSEYGLLSVPERTGYTFVGWYTDAIDGQQIVETSIVKITAQQRLYAHWEANEYQVSLDGMGADVAESERTVLFDGEYGELPELSREGYTFQGWILKDGTKINADSVVNVAENHVLYADWKGNPYTVTLNVGPGNSECDSVGVVYGDKYTGLRTPTLVGYTFLGWYTEEESGNLVNENTVVNTIGDHTLYAKYEANTYVVLFENVGDAGSIQPIEVRYDELYGELPSPEQAGCSFDGWYTEAEGGVQITEDDVVKIVENTTLYAHWKCKYTVSPVKANVASSTEVKAGTKVSLTCDTNGASIYFTTDETIGTNVSRYNGTLYEDAIVVTENITIYAIAVKEQHNSSEVITLSYTIIDESNDWGEITEADREAAGFSDAYEVPSGLWVTGISDSDYIGKAITFKDLHVYNHKTLLRPNVDYSIKYSNNYKVGTAKITITGKSNFKGTLVETFEIRPLDINNAIMSDVTLPYTGKVQKSTTKVTYVVDGKTVTLRNGVDFVYSYPGTDSKSADYNSDAFKACGTHEVVLIGKGNYAGTTTFNEVITNKYVIAKARMSAIPSQKYTGEAIEPGVKLTNGSKQLTEGVDYTVEYSDNLAVGKATVTITGIGEYAGTRTATFNITGTALNKTRLNGFVYSLPWSEEPVTQDITFSYTVGSGANRVTNYLVENQDYTISYLNNTKVGTATVIYTGIGGYTGTIKRTFKITGISMGSVKVTGLETNMVYACAEMIQQDYELTYTTGSGVNAQTVVLQEGTDYTVSYINNNKAGTATIVFTGINRYTGTLKKTYKITAYDIASAEGKVSVAEISTQPYTKGTTTPKPVVTYTDESGTIVLKEKTDYTLTYSNNLKIADKTALRAPTVTIVGRGNFKGRISVKFSITEGDISNATITATDIMYQNRVGICKPTLIIKDVNGKNLSPGVDYDRKIVYRYAKDVQVSKVVNGTVVYFIREEGEIVDAKDIIPVGAEITGTVKGINKYKGTQSVTFRYVAGSVTKASVKVEQQIFTGSAIEPDKDDITVVVGGKVLSKTDYEIVSYSNNVKCGYGKVTIRGTGNYSGEKTVSFRITAQTMNRNN